MQNLSIILLILIFIFPPFKLKGGANLDWDTYLRLPDQEKKKESALIENYRNNKLNWSSSSIQDLRELPLNDRILKILLRIKNAGNSFSSWTDFQNQTKFNSKEIKVLRNFITLDTGVKYDLEYNNYSKFYHENGSSHYHKNLQRLRLQFTESGFIGGVSEWDKGERDFWDYRNISFRTPYLLNRFKIYGGSYQLSWGEGLLFNKDLFNFRAASSIYRISSQKPKFYNYLSSSESQYLFGLGIEMELNHFQILPFYSVNPIDSKIKNNKIINISQSGQHVTKGQRKRKNNSKRTHLGVGTLYNYGSGHTGLLIYTTKFSHPIHGPNSKFFPGFSLIQNIKLGNIHFSGESSFFDKDNYAFSIHTSFEFEKIKIGYGYRYYSPYFYDALGCPNKNYSGNNRNEEGYNLGLSTELPGEIDIEGFVDFRSSIAPSKAGMFPTDAVEGNIEIQKEFGDRFQVRCKYKREVELGNTSHNQQKIKGKFTLFFKNFELISRAGYKNVEIDKKIENGFAHSIYFDVDFQPIPFQVGISNFYTKGFDSKIYLYEPGLPSRFNLPILFGTGSRYFLVINHRINDFFMLYFKGAYLNRKKYQSSNWKNKFNFEITFEINI